MNLLDQRSSRGADATKGLQGQWLEFKAYFSTRGQELVPLGLFSKESGVQRGGGGGGVEIWSQWSVNRDINSQRETTAKVREEDISRTFAACEEPRFFEDRVQEGISAQIKEPTTHSVVTIVAIIAAGAQKGMVTLWVHG